MTLNETDYDEEAEWFWKKVDANLMDIKDKYDLWEEGEINAEWVIGNLGLNDLEQISNYYQRKIERLKELNEV